MIKLIILYALGHNKVSSRMLFNSIKSYLILYMMILPVLITAQDFEWALSRENDYTLNPQLQSFIVSTHEDGNVDWAGMATYDQNYGSIAFGSLFFEKYDSQSNFLWGTEVNGSAAIIAYSSDSDGNNYTILRVLTSLEFQDGTVISYAGTTFGTYLIKLTNTFEPEWYIDLTEQISIAGTALSIDDQNRIYVGGGDFMNSRILVFDDEGTELNEIIQENVSVISSIDVDNEGNIYVAGSCPSSNASFNGVLADPGFIYSNYLVKYNAQFDFQWVKFIEDVTCSLPQVLCEDPDFVYLTGDLFLETMFDEIQADGPQWVYDFFVARLNVSGEFQWVIEVPEQSTLLGDAGLAPRKYCSLDEENNIFLAATIRGNIDWGNGIITESTNIGYDVMSMKINPEGDLIYALTGGGDLYEFAMSGSGDAEGTFYMTGYGSEELTFGNINIFQDESYPFLVKITSESVISVSDNVLGNKDILISPNPATELISVNINKNELEIINLEIVDFSGKIIRNIVSPSAGTIDVSDLNAGIYLLRITDNQKLVFTSRFIKK